MIDVKFKDIAQLPLKDAGITKKFSSSHNGVDAGWINNPYADVMAVQDGIVKEVGYSTNDIGNYVTIEHTYSDGTKRFTGYIHLKETPVVKAGQEVKVGQKIGVRGGSPYINGKAKFGVHLHLYVTKPTTEKYSWNKMKELVVDPMTQFKWGKPSGSTAYGVQDGYKMGNYPLYSDLIKEDDEITKLKKELEEKNALIKKLQDIISKIKELLNGI